MTSDLSVPVRRLPWCGVRRDAAALLLIVAVFAAGCGESGGDEEDQESAAEAWATQVCSSAVDWLTTMQASQDTLSDTGSLSADAARDAFDDVTTATTTLVSELKAVGTPETEAGDEAAAELSSLSEKADQQLAVISDTKAGNAGNVQELLAQVSTVTGAIATLVSDVSTAVENIRGLDGAQELENAFDSSSACQELRAMQGSRG